MRALFSFVLLTAALPGTVFAADDRGARWSDLASQYIECSGFLSATSDFLKDEYASLSSATQEAAMDAGARGVIALRKAYPGIRDSTIEAEYFDSRFNQIRQIWVEQINDGDYTRFDSQFVACQALLPVSLGDLKVQDFAPSFGI